MMKTAQMITILAAGALVIGTGIAQAQQNPACSPFGPPMSAATISPEAKAAMGDLRASMTEFAKTEIFPQMRVWKFELDNGMAPEDLQKLNDLRARNKALQAEKLALIKSMHQAWAKGDTATLKGGQEKFQALAARKRQILDELSPLVQQYQESLTTIGTAARPVVDGWQDKGYMMWQKWQEKYRDQLANTPTILPHFMPGMGIPQGPWARNQMVARFMLWDGGELQTELQTPTGTGVIE